MDMKKINSGKLRAIGYDAHARLLQVQIDDGSMLQYRCVGEETWRRLSSSGSACARLPAGAKQSVDSNGALIRYAQTGLIGLCSSGGCQQGTDPTR